ncbi:helix-turn-helix transcriptional regulator [Granulicoccus sp. GXG6511]|uniref:helix-turn-helix transcriptional regulator n=1 Tax=Granulicoccus sp. GXG6511 TaxID=3381351 RepID=UPI003D7CE581
MAGNELGEFLKARRAMVAPDPALLAELRPRRVPGLRREEVAQQAGLSPDYYTRLEQGRHRSPSEGVLNGLADALQLDSSARQHLFALARAATGTTGSVAADRRVQRVRPSLHQLLASIPHLPAFVRGRRTDVLAMNPLAGFVLHDFMAEPVRQRNLLRWALLDPEARTRYRDWAATVRSMVGTLRMDAGRHPDDPLLKELVGDLAVQSEEFRNWWAEQRVVERTAGVKRFNHPVVGELDVDYEALDVAGEEDQTLFIYTTRAGSESERKMRLLAGWVNEQAESAPDPDTGESAGGQGLPREASDREE